MTIGKQFTNTGGATNDTELKVFNPLADIEEKVIVEKEITTIRLESDLLDRVRAIAQIKNLTVQEVFEKFTEEYTSNMPEIVPNYKEIAEEYKSRFEKRRGKQSEKKQKNKK